MTPPGAEPGRPGGATLLRLMWLASPALPVGGFSYSEGLEAAVESGRVGDEAAATAWLLDQMHLGQMRSDWAVAAAAHAAWTAGAPDDARALNDWVRTSRETQEFRLQTEQMGRSLVDWLRNGPQPQDPRLAALAAFAPAPTWPVAFALAAVQAGADAREALLALGFGWAENMAQAAMKAVPLGQAAAQRLLGALADALPAAVEQALATPPERRQAHAPMLALLSAQHEVQYSRLFRS
ncbi:urease accessory protein UreF [Piscinibacter sakaiensis]|uniref:Urease accessory protein UreF n=1 Tax=Piscinibacter sakaiensis TaxID=1547922 RepID=A0A0K8P0R0_PISS1|nr:urease accessory UreF family protein [Piscinibacter sakaiensis]GAP35755.1 urease accessory protein UreF [Piscinibacter sakaiensis]